MNLIEESFQNKEEKKKKRTATIVLIAIILVVFIIIGIVAYMAYLQSKTLKLTLDGASKEEIKQLLVFEEDGTIYVPIKEIAKYFGYESYNGEYQGISEEMSKCYVQSENEIANFTLGSNKIYKLDLTKKSSEYEYVYSKKQVKAINGVLYASTEAIEKAFNLSFQYDQENNRITILTMPYLIDFYKSKILDYGYTELNDTLVNNKAVLQNILIVKKDQKYGVIDVSGNIILEPKYDNITYLSNTGDFLVESNKKVGILSSKKETKVQIMYNSIELMDSDAGLYLVKNDNNKYGVIDIKGNIKIYIENDEIGIDTSKFSSNNIKNKYILAGNLIPVKKDGYWGLYDKKGNQIVEHKYDSLGYIASSNKDAMNLLVIPDYNVLVACKDKKYTLINSSGEELFATVADDIYMAISGGEYYYYISVNDQLIDAIAYLDSRGIKATSSSGSSSSSSSTSNKNSNTSTSSNSMSANTTSSDNTEMEED